MYVDITLLSFIILIISTLFLMLAVELTDLLKAAISLGVASAMLAVIFFILNAPYAAVFELSVCVGLITVLFISTISLTKGEE